MWYNYTMEYYTHKKKVILKYAGKWMELENILNEVTQIKKDNYYMYSLISVFLNIKQRKPAHIS